MIGCMITCTCNTKQQYCGQSSGGQALNMNSGNNKIAAKRNKKNFRNRKQREKETVKVEDDGPDLEAIKLEMIKHLASKFNMEQ